MSASPSVVSVSDEPPRKKLRKGTHSCIECRRRKKSCVARPATPGCCEECFNRGIQCHKQEVSLGTKRRVGEGKQNLPERVAELETALISLSQKLGTTPSIIESEDGAAKALEQLRSGLSPSKPVASPVLNPEALLEHAPVFTLFDNAILSRRPDDDTGEEPNAVGSPHIGPKIDLDPKINKVRRVLLSFFPSQQRQEAILNASDAWWASWQTVFPRIFGFDLSVTAVQFIADLKASGNVQKIAKALLCLLVILQEGSASLNTIHDIANAADQTRQALSTLDDMVLNDDELAGTIDGIECMVLRTKYETNNGRIRRAWLTYRRGISFAQLLGLHKRLSNSEGNMTEKMRRESVWNALYSGDRFMSLILGLPYGPSEIHPKVGRDSELSANRMQVQDDSEHYVFRLASVVGHIIDRNQQLPSNNMLPLTFKIEAELMELQGSMTDDWWKPEPSPSGRADQIYSHFLPQFWHHQARTLLHLPFMLKASTDRRFKYNKEATLESAREMIARYRIIRPLQGFGCLICKVIDFQVFTAAMILVLHLLDHYRESLSFDQKEAKNDQDLILVTTHILQRAAVETDGSVATQAARALEIFGNIKDMPLHAANLVGECTMKVVIPYFGTVVIGPGMSFKDQPSAQQSEVMLQPQQLPTPSDQSLDGCTPQSTLSSNSTMIPMAPFDLNTVENTQGMHMSGNVFADVNFDLDQDWNWFWNNIDIPSVDLQGTPT